MLKSIAIPICLVVFLSGCAAIPGAALLATAGGLTAGSIGAYTLSPNSADLYKYMNPAVAPRPKDALFGPHHVFADSRETHVIKTLEGELYFGVSKPAPKWITQKEWEDRFGAINEADLQNIRNCFP